MKMFGWRAFVLLIALAAAPAQAEEAMQGLSLYGAPAYATGFTHFPYTNPDAPKGGAIKMGAIGTYDTVNPFTLKGVAAADAGLVFDTLMDASLDEPFSQYGRVAETVTVAKDKSWVSYKIRLEARFHDGSKITPDDIIFSFETLRDKGHPTYRTYYKDVTKAEKTGPDTVKFSFKTKENTELPLIMGQLPVLEKKFWAGKDFAATTLEPIAASGPYEIANIAPGRSITYRRVKNWWGANMPFAKGRYNFDDITYDYYRDVTVALEAFFAGRYDFRLENVSKYWATAYNTPAVKKGQIIKAELPNALPVGMQGFIFNLRRPLFKDVRVRQALDLAFDFAWSNKTVAYGAYKRTASYFENSELAAKGLPSPDEIALLAPYRSQIPASVFTTAYENPQTDGSGDNRANLMKAAELLKEAGWTLKDGKLIDAAGKPFTFEIVDSSPMFERWVQPWLRNLERLGIQATLRSVDTAQYQNMIDNFNFDVTIHVFPQSISPGNEQRDFWTSAKADQVGSRNLIGIKDPVVDALVEKLVHAPDRAALITACRALDRVLLAGHYVIPHWYNGVYRIAYWDKFGMPKVLPKYGLAIPDAWWADEAKAKNSK